MEETPRWMSQRDADALRSVGLDPMRAETIDLLVAAPIAYISKAHGGCSCCGCTVQ
jgi:hypothetical protein